jgi:hypothetical protein
VQKFGVVGILQISYQWISGQYVLPESNSLLSTDEGFEPIIIAATYSRELFEVAYFKYGFQSEPNDRAFIPYVRHIWPVHSRQIFVYESNGDGPLISKGPYWPPGFTEFARFVDPYSPQTVAELMCPFMDSLIPYRTGVHSLSNNVLDNEGFLQMWKIFENRESPNFWGKNLHKGIWRPK